MVNALALGLGISGSDDFTARIGAISMISTITVSYAKFTKFDDFAILMLPTLLDSRS